MQYSDLTYLLLFLPLVIIIYSISPKKYRYIVLLLSSYIFFYSISSYLITYSLISTILIYIITKILSKLKDKEKLLTESLEKEERKIIKKKYLKKRKLTLIIGIISLLITLILTKYLNFITISFNDLMKILNVNFKIHFSNLIAPIGISFYTLEGISYLVDVYNGKCEKENNILKLSLYLTFFPKLMEGPITRYNEIKDSLYAGNKINYKNLTFGLQRITYGLIKKIVVANRIHNVIDPIFANYLKYDGGVLFIGIILYVIELYMDFSGIMDIVIGTSEIFGITLPENFKRPFFSRSISDFWSRWHVTLGTFFKDYIFYPVSLSKFSRNLTSKMRKKLGNHFGPLVSGTVALLLVWLSNGLWHGANYNFIAFGLYHFTFILLGNIFSPLLNSFYTKSNINKDNFVIKVLSITKTTIIVIFGEIFFRAMSLKSALHIIKEIFTNFNLKFLYNHTFLKLGLDSKDIIIIILTIIIVFIIGILNEKNISVREEISKKNIIIRWAIYYLLIFYLLIFGAYLGPYTPVDPMYASF
ncbi:MAG: MBOAT family protein [Tenericutes bacterium]|nr:MBOAT family protein [Mycoplasmatota bacterium]